MLENSYMDNNLKNLLESCPFTVEFSKFEQESFGAVSSAGYPRYIISLINRYRKLDSDLEKEDRTFERNVLLAEKQKIEEILADQDIEKMNNAVANWEKVEADYWADTLGKVAAIEILTNGKLTYDTMMKMAKLPESLYIKSSQICVQLANTIKQKTVEAEEAIGLMTEEAPVQTTAPAPKKLFLKKTK